MNHFKIIIFFDLLRNITLNSLRWWGVNALVLVAPSVPLSSSSLLPSITCKSSSLLRYLSSPCLLKLNANKCPGVEWYGGLVIENIVQTIYQWVCGYITVWNTGWATASRSGPFRRPFRVGDRVLGAGDFELPVNKMHGKIRWPQLKQSYDIICKHRQKWTPRFQKAIGLVWMRCSEL